MHLAIFKELISLDSISKRIQLCLSGMVYIFRNLKDHLV